MGIETMPTLREAVGWARLSCPRGYTETDEPQTLDALAQIVLNQKPSRGFNG